MSQSCEILFHSVALQFQLLWISLLYPLRHISSISLFVPFFLDKGFGYSHNQEYMTISFEQVMVVSQSISKSDLLSDAFRIP